jgi:hypothetical protein
MILIGLLLGIPMTPPIIGYIDRLDGPAVFIKAKDAPKETHLGPSDAKRLLHESDVVRCGPKSHTVLWIAGRSFPIGPGKKMEAARTPSTRSAENDKLAWLNNAFSVGGRVRGSDRGTIWSPADTSCIDPDTFIPGYIVDSNSEIAVVNNNNESIWSFEDHGHPIPADETERLRAKLKGLQKPSARVSLSFSVEYKASKSDSTFELLSADEERDLGLKLNACDKEPDPFRRMLERAATYANYGLINDQVRELEGLAEQFPKSTELVETVRKMEHEIGMPR